MSIPLYPIYVYEEGFTPPTEGTYYILTQDGLYIHKSNALGSTMSPVKGGVPWLQPANTTFKPNLPQIPSLIIGQAWSFFRSVFEKHSSESYLTLLFNVKAQQYKLHCPKQSVSGGNASYGIVAGDLVETTTKDGQKVIVDANARYDSIAPADRKGWVIIGTIHSHCDFDAFHSGTDTHDETQMDGIHITIGHVNSEHCSVSSEIAVNGVRYKIDPSKACPGLKQVQPEVEPTISRIGFASTSIGGKCGRFELNLTAEESKLLAQDEVMIQKEWMPLVTKKPEPAKTWFKSSKKTNPRYDLFSRNDDYPFDDESNFLD